MEKDKDKKLKRKEGRNEELENEYYYNHRIENDICMEIDYQNAITEIKDYCLRR